MLLRVRWAALDANETGDVEVEAPPTCGDTIDVGESREPLAVEHVVMNDEGAEREIGAWVWGISKSAQWRHRQSITNLELLGRGPEDDKGDGLTVILLSNPLAPIILDEVVIVASSKPEAIGLRMRLRGPLTRIGRHSDSDISTPEDDLMASRHHAILARAADGTWWLTDLRSPNGTLVNDVPVIGCTPLRGGDCFAIGATVLRYVHGGTH